LICLFVLLFKLSRSQILSPGDAQIVGNFIVADLDGPVGGKWRTEFKSFEVLKQETRQILKQPSEPKQIPLPDSHHNHMTTAIEITNRDSQNVDAKA